MFGLLLYFLFGYCVMNYARPVQFAAGYAVSSGVLSLVFGDRLLSVLLSGAIVFGYTAFVYMVVDRYNDNIVAPVGVLVAGAAIMIGAAFVV